MKIARWFVLFLGIVSLGMNSGEKSRKVPYVDLKTNKMGETIEEGKDMYGISYKKYREKFDGGEQWVVLSDPKNKGTMTNKVIIKEYDSPFINETLTFELKDGKWVLISKEQQERKAQR
ncbi:MAG: hypothetical protein HYV97_16535 [Bdellovibrio sp.]|nr:hypothetical protein [Bdellovibrio sp.]